MSKVGGRRNFGYGKTLAWAGKNALKDRYGHGHFATRAAHTARWRQFSEFAKRQGIRDARQIGQRLLADYGSDLAQRVRKGEMAIAYAQNLLSTVNVVLGTLRGDQQLRVSPARAVGERTHVRQAAPGSLDPKFLDSRVQGLTDRGEDRVAVVAELARQLGLRFREASLLDARQALRQARQRQPINITAGTKGGRGKSQARWVPVSAAARSALARAAGLQLDGPNLLPPGLSFRQWRDHAYWVWRGSATGDAPTGFHALRAAYACDRYRELTGQPAPCVAGGRAASQAADAAARVILAQELGHGRTDVVASYLGSAR